MSEATEFRIGSDVVCRDGVCGELRRVVIDPIAGTLTHLVVEAKHQQGSGRLVPVELVEGTTEQIQLRCSLSEFAALEDAEETQFISGPAGQWGYAEGEMLAWPYYGLGLGGTGISGMVGGPPVTIHDRVPAGEVEVRRGEHVHATDGAIGRVQGLVVDRADHHVTHVLLDTGHRWDKKEVAIPISAVKQVDGEVRVNLTRDQVRDLPEVDVERPA
jgi:sporulation protein YlmC with PRC-barrel domain